MASSLLLASAADDIRIWTGERYTELVKQYQPHIKNVSSLAWNSTNNLLASTSILGEKISIASQEAGYFTIDYPMSEEPISLCWHGSSRIIATGCTDGVVRLYDLKHKKIRKEYPGHSGPVTCVSFNRSDTTVASASKAGEVTLHSTVTETSTKLITSLKLQAIQDMEYSHCSPSLLATVSDDASLVLWDTNARRSIHQFPRSHKAPSTGLSFSPSNDKLLLSCGLDKRMVLYDVLSKSIVRNMQLETPLSSICMHDDGCQIATGTIRGQIFIHDLRMGSNLQQTIAAHRSSVQCLVFQHLEPKKASRDFTSVITRQPSVAVHEASRGTAIVKEDTQGFAAEHNSGHHYSEASQAPANGVPAHWAEENNAQRGAPLVKAHDEQPILRNQNEKAATQTAINGTHSAITKTDIFSPEVDAQRNAPVRKVPDHVQISSSQNGITDISENVFSPDVEPEGTSAHHLPARSVRDQLTMLNQITSPNARAANSINVTPLTSPRGFTTSSLAQQLATKQLPMSQITTQKLTTSKRSPVSSARPSPTAEPVLCDEDSAAPSRTHSGASGAASASVESCTTHITDGLKEDLRRELRSELMSSIKDMIDSVKEDLQQSLMEHHYEMIRQFFLLQKHVETQVSTYSLNHALLKENEELRAELERLKRTY